MILVYVLFGLLTLRISANKSDTFPPIDKLRKHYDLDQIVKTCYEKSGADQNELHEFEVSTDLEHLPNSHTLKVYFRCFAEVSGSVEPKSNKIILTKFLNYWEDLTQAEQEIYLNMGKGCLGGAKKISDRLEYSYAILICGKRNDNEHFHVFY